MTTHLAPPRRGQRWITSREAAEYSGLHEETIRTLMRRGELAAVKVSRTWRTTIDAVDQLMAGGAS